MSISYCNIKIEPEPPCTVQNDEDIDETIYPKQALDLSKKSSNNVSEKESNESDSLEIRPEFVNIKMEIDAFHTTVKQEENSESDEDALPLSWHRPMNDISQPASVTNIVFEVPIKQEPVETMAQHNTHEETVLLVGRSCKSQTLDGNEVSEEVLRLNSTPDGKYMCPVCHNRFSTKGLVQRHQLLHNKEKLQCSICLRNFVKAGHLKKHILSHSTVKSYDCPECGKQFKTTSNLGQHQKTHLVTKPFKCELCDRQFAVKANLIKHQGKSRCKRASDLPIVCNICNKVFQKEFLLRSHLRRHTTEKPYTCETCQVSFKYKSTLIRHIQLHNGIKPYSCKICDKTFTHAGLIKPHMRKHTGEKPYPCPICKKMFAHKHNMERHTIRHNKIKHLDCNICHKKFPKESRLRYHMRIHTNEKPFACKVCPKKFSHKQNVIRHYGRKHPGKVFDCELTDASFARDVWESVVQKKEMNFMKKEELEPIESCESNDEYVIP